MCIPRGMNVLTPLMILAPVGSVVDMVLIVDDGGL